MKLLRYLITLLVFLLSFSYFSLSVPSLDDLGDNNIGYGTIGGIQKDSSMIDNIKRLFFPSGNGGQVWDSLRTILVGILVIFFIWSGALFVLKAGDEGELKKAKLNIVYIFYGAFLIFASTWLLGSTVLNIGGDGASASNVLENTKSDILVNILVFFKSLAYFVAIVMFVYYGFKIMQAQEKEDKIKAGKNGVLNIILALVGLKILDYLYYIAQQETFRSEAQGFLTATGKLLGWILGVVIILVLIYSGILLVTSRGNEEAMKKAKTIIRNVFLVILVVFLFIVIVYDIVKNLNF